MQSGDLSRTSTKGKEELRAFLSSLWLLRFSFSHSFFSTFTRDGREHVAKLTPCLPLCCRYKVLMRNLALPEDIRGKCTVLLQLYDASNSEWQLGKTKVQWQEHLPPHLSSVCVCVCVVCVCVVCVVCV